MVKFVGAESDDRWSAKVYTDKWSPSTLTSVRDDVFDLEKEEKVGSELQYVLIDELSIEYKDKFLKWLGDKKFQVVHVTKILGETTIHDNIIYGALLEDWMNWLKWKLKEIEKKPKPIGRTI